MKNSNKKIVLITTGQPSCNPRIVKEADALQDEGFDVTLLYCFFINWASEKDEVLLKDVKWKYKIVGGSPIGLKKLYFFTRVRHKVAKILNKLFTNNYFIAERAQARAYDELLREAKKTKADFYIGHNLGALSIAVKAANYNNAKAGFDFEDYHRGETNEAKKEEIDRIIYLENKYVTKLDYISAASPLIAKKIGDHFPLQKKIIITLLNCFPLSQQPSFREKAAGDNSLQLFWFSQTIGLNRGLEILIKALVEMNDPDIHLTLAGNCSKTFKQYLDSNAELIIRRIHLPGIIPPAELPEFSSRFDVGLALELQIPENRDICLTNKIFTYILAGNALLLSESAMQKRFNDEFALGHGFPIQNIRVLIDKIRLLKNQAHLNHQRKYNYELGQNLFNWEIESRVLLEKLKAELG